MTSLQETRTPTNAELAEVVEALADADRLLVATHESPDGDALGSLLAAKLGCEQLGIDVVMFLPGSLALPREYAFMDLADLQRNPPEDLQERVLLALDCANAQRLGPDRDLLARPRLVINIDHHHDNTRFGDINLVMPEASSTGEILKDVLDLLGARLTPEIAEAIYIALVTDTGRFQYSNTEPRTLRLAAELIEAGANAQLVFQEVYENVAFAKIKLLARALEHAQAWEGGRLIISMLTRGDFAAARADEPFAEGIIDHLRAIEGSEMAALIREPAPDRGAPLRKVSLRTAHEAIDVSKIARDLGGGGHRQAAGFPSDRPLKELVTLLREAFREQADSLAA